MKKIFLISPVRVITEEEKAAIAKYVDEVECNRTIKIHWPLRDDQNFSSMMIYSQNLAAMRESDEIRIWLKRSKLTEEILFYFGIAFSLGKPIFLVHREKIRPTEEESFVNILLELDFASRVRCGIIGL